ncbi:MULTISPECIES: ABC transporter permease [unclassified Fibrobacter]|uniref:ABC transporter permease n=1 Tax=unclassified Fibrobacter TaxID=2634177 RepID=UPI000DB2032A|nr:MULTISPECIES: ABC transporter permease [unclassified Fibrobacter]PZW69440.1 ABC-2 type transport system permease protein [Fibrobacter sp. UWR1]
MFRSFFRTVRKVYFGHNLVMWLVILILPMATSIFMVDVFSAEILQHIPVGVIKQDRSQFADELEDGLHANPVVDVVLECEDFSECEHAVVKGELQAFVLLPYDLERRALRLESPVIPVFSSGQNYLTNSFATKEIRTVISSIGSNLFTKGMDEPVKVSLQSVGNSTGNYQGFLGMGLVTAIFHLACILAAVYIFSLPFRDHRVREYLAAAGGSRVILGLATILPLGLIQSMAMIGVYAYTHRFMAPMTLDEFIITASGQMAMVFACNGAGAAFVAITGNMRMSTSVAGVIAGPAFAFAGQTFPIMAMPLAVRCFAFCLPLTHVLKVQSCMLLGSAGKAHAWESIVVLLVMALFWHLLASRLLFVRWKKAAKREEERNLVSVNLMGEAIKK